MAIEQKAGEIEIVAHTDGSPIWVNVKIGRTEADLLNVSDLHDLRYCIDRVLKQLEGGA